MTDANTRSSGESSAEDVGCKLDSLSVVKRHLEKCSTVVSFTMHIDSKTFFYTIMRPSLTAERRLLDCHCCYKRHLYSTRQMRSVEFIRKQRNRADPFTKNGKHQCLDEIIATGRVVHPTEQ